MKLSVQFAVLTSALIAILFIGVAYFQADTLREYLIREQIGWSKTLATSIAETEASAIINGKSVFVREALEHIVDSNKEVAYIYITGFNQQVFAHTFANGFPAKLLQFHEHLVSKPQSMMSKLDDEGRGGDIHWLTLDGREILDVSFPVIQGMSSHLHLGIDQGQHEALYRKMFGELAMLFLLAALGGAVLSFVLGKFLTRPLQALMVQLKRFGDGEKVTLTPAPDAPREIRDLESSFQEMIMARKQIEQELKQFKSTLDYTTDCIFMFDTDDLLFSYVNDGALVQVGYTRKEMRSMHPYDIKPDVSKAGFQQLIKPMLAGEKSSISFETVHQHKNGARISVEIFLQYIAPIDEPARFVAFVHDITERKKTEAVLDKYRHHLRELVEEKTSELATALGVAEEANQAKTEFLSRMSHELRTPLNAILGFGQLLEMDAEGFSATQQGNIKEILDAGDHLLNLVNDVLDLARIESGKLDISMSEISVNDLLPPCLKLITVQAEARQLKVIDNISNKGYRVVADAGRFKQVLVNLLSNAVKYNREQGSITLDGKVIDGQRLRICITDTGEGLAAEDIEKLFASFERLNPVNNVEGTGIGLVISKQLTELMGGRIGVDSTPGKGSTFWVEFKLPE